MEWENLGDLLSPVTLEKLRVKSRDSSHECPIHRGTATPQARDEIKDKNKSEIMQKSLDTAADPRLNFSHLLWTCCDG